MTAVSRSRVARIVTSLAALATLLAVLVGVPALMVAIDAVPRSAPSLHEFWTKITSRDDQSQVLFVVLAVIVWLCWTAFLIATAREVAAAVASRGTRTARPIRGLRFASRPAASLVAAAATLFVAAPVAFSATAATRGVAETPHPPQPGDEAPAVAAAAVGGTEQVAHRHPQASIVVRRYDTLWRIAARHLPGDPARRYLDIKRLNPDGVGPDNTITPGTALLLPDDAINLPAAPNASDDTSVTVQRGDSLWAIEERVTGDGTNWTDAWHLNEGRPEPHGQRFTHPDLIMPGWTVTIPLADKVQARTALNQSNSPPHSPPAPTPSERSDPQPPLPASPIPPTLAPSSATPSPAAHMDHVEKPAAQDDHEDNNYVGLTVGGGLLAAGSFAALLAYRRRKFHLRRPRRVVAPLPDELLALEDALIGVGRPALPTATFLDLALRSLAAEFARQPGAGLPDVVAASINGERLELHLARPAGLAPSPWIATAPTLWTLDRYTALPANAVSATAPYPCLVSVGYRKSDNTEFLVDLEHARSVQLAGDRGRCTDLARYLLAELSHNPWSDNIAITVVGFGQEMVGANPSRIAYSHDGHSAVQMLTRVAAENRRVAETIGGDVLGGRLRGDGGDVWMPQVVLAVSNDDEDPLDALGGEGRVAVALVSVGYSTVSAPAMRLTISADGSLSADALDSEDLVAHGLPLAEAEDLARAIAFERDGNVDAPTPRSTGDEPWHADTDAAGALVDTHTVPRSTPRSAIQHETSSLLPGDDREYLDAAATTKDELAALAPLVSVATRQPVEESDPELDELVAAWHDRDSGLAKLQLLGPVRLTAHGRPPPKQPDMCIQAIAYLAMRPYGATPDEFANDLWPHKDYSGSDKYPQTVASWVRFWLGENPRTGREYLSRAGEDGRWVYRINGLLVGTDLFTRLRRRAEARGADGLPDLVTALGLATGGPFSQRRLDWPWLRPDEELLYAGAIIDVADTVAIESLRLGELQQARRACETALQVDPDSERILRQLAKVHDAAGRHAEKEAVILRLKSLDEDFSDDTVGVMRRNGWLAHGA